MKIWCRITETTKAKAITRAKKKIRDKAGVKRLPNFYYESCSSSCSCGETAAVYCTSYFEGRIKEKISIAISICKTCGEK